MLKHWHISSDEHGAAVVSHLAAPRFTAHWHTGDDPEALAELEGLCWRDEGSDGEDGIHLHGFVWFDSPPGQAEFQALMQQAAQAIDAWIAANF